MAFSHDKSGQEMGSYSDELDKKKEEKRQNFKNEILSLVQQDFNEASVKSLQKLLSEPSTFYYMDEEGSTQQTFETSAFHGEVSEVFIHTKEKIRRSTIANLFDEKDVLAYLIEVMGRKDLNQDSLEKYIELCINQLLQDKLTSASFVMIQRVLYFSLQYKKYELTERILMHPELQAYILLTSSFNESEQSNTKTNLLYAFLMQETNQSDHASIHLDGKGEIVSFPITILDHILSKNKANNHLALLLSYYIRYQLYQLNELTSKLQRTTNDFANPSVRGHFTEYYLRAMKSYAAWQHIVSKEAIDSNIVSKLDNKISRQFNAIFESLSNKINVEQISLVQQLNSQISQFCKDEKIDNRAAMNVNHHLSEKYSALSRTQKNHEAIDFQNRLKTAEKNKTYAINLRELYTNTAFSLNQLCDSIANLMEDKKLKSLKGMKRATIRDDDNKRHHFSNWKTLGAYLQKINQSQIPLSEKLERIISILQKVYRSAIEKRSIFSRGESKTAAAIKTELDRFVEKLNELKELKALGISNLSVKLQDDSKNKKVISVTHEGDIVKKLKELETTLEEKETLVKKSGFKF